jgi:flavorubredoxin
MSTALVVYSTKKSATEGIAACIAEGLREAGVEVEVKGSAEIKDSAHLEGYDGYVFGSATYHGEMLQHSKQLLFVADKANLKGKVGAAFGAFGWSGEAPSRIFATMEHILGMDMVEEPLRLKSPITEEECEKGREYGRLVAARLSR